MPDTSGALDRQMMRRALREARRGRPSPNPHVGAVVVRQGRVVGVGHHERAGLAHAEVAALRMAGAQARGATLYVTFEPCNHQGRTGPCTVAIVDAGIARVVIGCRDPAPHVPGAIERLRAANIEVTVGVLEEDATVLIEDFAKHITTGFPFVTLKAALTLDGRIATRTGDSRWISGEASRKRAHRMRSESDAVLVGIGTVLADDPALTVRHVEGPEPLRVALDSHLRIPETSQLVQHKGDRPLIVFHSPNASPDRKHALAARGVELVAVPEANHSLELPAVLDELGKRDVVRLLVEGGAKLHGTLLRSKLADGFAFFVAPKILGDPAALPLANIGPSERIADAYRLDFRRVRRSGDDVLLEGRVRYETTM